MNYQNNYQNFNLSLYDKHIDGKGRKCHHTFHRIKQCWDLGELWTKANLPEEGGKWRKIGFTTEAPKWEIQRVGYLGLENMHGFMKKDINVYQKVTNILLFFIIKL